MNWTGATALGLLPLVVYCALVANWLWGWGRRGPGVVAEAGGLREGMLLSALVCGLWVALGTEVLGQFRAVSRVPLLLWWAMPATVLLVMLVRRCHGGAAAEGRVQTCSPADVTRMERGAWVPLGACAALLALAGLVAVLSPPNTFDAMRYHMPRQVGWMQQGSVEHFITGNPNVLIMPPLAEFMGLHLMVLSGGDLYSTLVQWFALVIAAVAASLVARELGGGQIAQVMSALLVVSNPMAWLQASSAKNDVLAGLWVLIAAWGVARAMRTGECSWRLTLVLGAAAGLGLATKATAAIFLLPMMTAFSVWWFWSGGGRGRRLGAIGIIALIGLIPSAGHFGRNFDLFGSPTASSKVKGVQLTNEAHTAPAIVSVMVKNLALHAGTPWPDVNRATDHLLVRLHGAMGWDSNDERTTAYAPLEVIWAQRYEEKAAAPIHVLFIIASALYVPVMLVRARCLGRESGGGAEPQDRGAAVRAAVFLACVFAAFTLFCVLLKWQPWHARLHVGVLALAAPVSAAILCRGRGVGAVPVVVLLLLVIAPTILWNRSRPLTGEESILGRSRPAMLERRPAAREGIAEAVQMVAASGARLVGLSLNIQGPYAVQRRLLMLDAPPEMMDAAAIPELLERRAVPVPDLIISDGKSWPRMVHEPSGTIMYNIAEHGAYRIFATRPFAERLLARGLIERAPARVQTR